MWVELTNGIHVNLAMIEAVVPPDERHVLWRFFHPRSQRGGRPYGRPPDRPGSHNDDAGCWEGTPTDPEALVAFLRASRANGARAMGEGDHHPTPEASP